MDHTAQRGLDCIANVHLHWEAIGSGPPLVLLHGLTDSHRTWSRVAPALARTHRVLMLDLPGHGLSDRPDASYSLEWHAKIVAAWMDHLQLEQADVIGHSFGGGVAQWLLLERRERVRRLGLVAAGGLGRDVAFSLRLASLPRVVQAFGQPFMGIGTHVTLRSLRAAYASAEIADLSWMNARPGSARALARTVKDVIDLRGQRRHFLDRAHEVGELPPIAVFWGSSDPVIPPTHARALLSHLDGATLTEFPGCGHFPHRERPDLFVEALHRFLDAPTMAPARLKNVRAIAISARARPRRISWLSRTWHAVTRSFRSLFRRTRASKHSVV